MEGTLLFPLLLPNLHVMFLSWLKFTIMCMLVLIHPREIRPSLRKTPWLLTNASGDAEYWVRNLVCVLENHSLW